MSLFLTQQEANDLLALEKHCDDSEQFKFPDLGGSLRIPLFSADHREEFSLDITRGYVALKKNTYQTRARRSIILARLDINGPPHGNPDGEEIACPHLHIYREGWADKWAIPLPDAFDSSADAWAMLSSFMNYCKVVTPPMIVRGLFQ